MEKLKKKIQFAVDVFKSGRVLEAQDLTIQLISENPNVTFLYNLMGVILAEQNKFEEALEYYEKGIKIDPNSSVIYNNLGLLYANKSKSTKAEAFYKKSISLNYKNPEAHNNLGSLYESLDKFKDAIGCYNEAVKIDPKFIHAYHNLGNAHTMMGNFDEAKINFFKAIEIHPYYTKSHRTLSRIIKYSSDNNHFLELQKIYKKIKDDNIEDKTNISFALGKAYEDIKDYEQSFKYYSEANTFYGKKVNFSMIKEKEKCEEIKNTFNKNIFEKYKNCGSDDSSIIFILGMPRSGTTLVEQILSSHPKVFGGDERDFITDLLKENFGSKVSDLKIFFEGVLDFDKKKFKEIGEKYVEKMFYISNKSKKSTDKMPANFLWIGFIKLILPNSKIIHCYRNSRDNCLSIYKNHFPGGKINYSYDLDKIVGYYNMYLDLMSHWNDLLPEFIFSIKYENLITNPSMEIRDLLNFCNLDWNDACLNSHDNKRIVKTASDVQARNKMNNKSINSWINYEKYLNKSLSKLKN